MLRQKALSLYEDFQKRDEKEGETKPCIASRGWLHRFSKNIKIVGEASSADEEAAVTFPAELKKTIKEGK